MLNSLAIGLLQKVGMGFPQGFDLSKGHLFDEDLWLRNALGGMPPDLARVSRELASYGVASITDMTPSNDFDSVEFFRSQQNAGKLCQRLLVAGVQDLISQPGSANDRKLELGPFKIHLHEAHLPGFDEMCDAVKMSHLARRPIAVHCVTQVELVFALAVLTEVGAIKGDRIEHASVTPPELLEQLKDLGVVVVTQPNFIAERGDQYRRDIKARELPWLYRCRSLIEAGISVAGGTDAPFGKPDPWLAIQAATSRKTCGGDTINAQEALSPENALGLFLGSLEMPDVRRQLVIGAQADLCLLDRSWRQARKTLASEMVRATWCDGELIFDRIDQSPG